MVYRETFSPMNEQEITNIEIQFNVQFPTDYRMYLKEIGGGFAEWSESNGIYVEDVKDKVFIDEMFGNIDIDSARIDFWTKKYQDEMFEKSIIIGDSLEHGFFVLVCEGEDKRQTPCSSWKTTWPTSLPMRPRPTTTHSSAFPAIISPK